MVFRMMNEGETEKKRLDKTIFPTQKLVPHKINVKPYQMRIHTLKATGINDVLRI